MASDGFKLARDGRGNYKRDLGWERTETTEYRQHRFYLGKDRSQAVIRSLHLERVWDSVCQAWQRDRLTPRPEWNSVSLAIGLSVSRGEEVCALDPADHYKDSESAPYGVLNSGYGLLDWFNRLQATFPSVRLALPEQAEAKREQAEAKQRAHLDGSRRMLEIAEQELLGNQTLHQALDAYEKYLGETMLLPDGTGRKSPTAKLWQRQTRQIKAQVKDLPLALFDQGQVDKLIDHWKNRPIMPRTGRPAGEETVRDCIKRIRTFIRWLHKDAEWKWRKPADYEVTRVKIRLTPAEKAAKKTPNRVPTYNLDELCTLWEYASPYERQFLVLALNCGYAADMISMLQVDDVHLDGVHPDHGEIGPWIGRVRFKTGVYGEWTLWPETVKAMEWVQRRRGESKEPTLLLTKTGKPLSDYSAGSNRNMAVPNAWGLLVKRVQKDFPDFRKLSFAKVKKTAIDFVRKAKSGETARVFSCRGTVTSDVQLERYSNRDFLTVFSGIKAFRQYLEPMFGRVADPFPLDMRKSNPTVTPGQVKRMKELRAQGYTLKKIGELVGYTDETVRQYLRKA